MNINKTVTPRVTLAQLDAMFAAHISGNRFNNPRVRAWIIKDGNCPTAPIAWAQGRHGPAWGLCLFVDAGMATPISPEFLEMIDAEAPMRAASFDPNVGLDE